MLQAETAQNEVSRFLPGVDSQLIGKTELAVELGWSRPRLDRRLQSDPRFPVVYRGGQGRGREWKFDLDAVRDYLEGRPESEIDADAMGESTRVTNPGGEKKATAVDPDVTRLPPAEHYAETTALARRNTAQAQLLEDKLRRERGQLVAVDDLRDTLSIAMQRLAKGLDSLPDVIVSRLQLSAAHALTIREMVNVMRHGLVTELKPLLEPNDAG